MAEKRHRPLVLVAERDPFTRDVLSKTLGDRFRLEFVDDGQEVLARAAGRQPALIVLEILLPTLDGLEVCRQLKSNAATRHIPVVIFSWLLAGERAEQAGADAFLLKPLQKDLFLATVQRLLGAASDPRSA